MKIVNGQKPSTIVAKKLHLIDVLESPDTCPEHLQNKSMDWFLYDMYLRHERVKYVQFSS